MSMPANTNEAPVLTLAKRQLEAYNRGDIDAFCDCYAPDVVVYYAEGQVSIEGEAAFRERYDALFKKFRTFGRISARLCLPPHVVEHEHWERTERETEASSSGEVLVRYTEKNGRIAIVQFLMPPA